MIKKYEYMNKLLNGLSVRDFVHTESYRKQVISTNSTTRNLPFLRFPVRSGLWL